MGQGQLDISLQVRLASLKMTTYHSPVGMKHISSSDDLNFEPKRYRLIERWLNCSIRWCFLTYVPKDRIAKAEDDPDGSLERSNLKVLQDQRILSSEFDRWHDLWKLFNPFSKYESKLLRLLYLLRIVFIVVMFYRAYIAGSVLILTAKHDHQWKVNSPYTSRIPNPSEFETACKLFHPDSWSLDSLELILKLQEKIRTLSMLPTVMGFSEVLYAYLVMIPFNLLIFTAIAIKGRRFSIQVLDFICNPTAEIQRSRTEINELNLAISESLEEICRDQLSMCWNNMSHNEKTSKSRYRNFTKNGGPLSGLDRYEIQAPIEKILSEIYILDLVKPANLTAEAGRVLLKAVKTLCLFIWPAEVAVLVLCYVLSVWMNCYHQAWFRVGSVQCSDQGLNASSLHLFERKGYQIEKEISTAELDEYRRIEWPSAFQREWNHLIIRYELFRYFESHWLEVIITFLISLWAFNHNCVNTLVFTAALHSQSTWLKQIDCQITECCQSVLAWHQSSRKNQDADAVLKENLICYLNYLQYRRRYRDFKRYCDFVSHQLTILSTAVLLSCYFVGTYTMCPHYTVINIVTLSFVVTINLVCMIPASLLNRNMKIRKKIGRLVALEIQLGSKFWIPMKLWQRQLLKESELNFLFAQTSIVGCISYNHLITLNGYLLALWIMVFKM